MSVKVVQITIPSDRNLPDIINSFTPEENYLMIKIVHLDIPFGIKFTHIN